MIVHLDTASVIPVFEQLRSQIERLIASGQLRPGTKLPPIRQLASDLSLARGTVNKVYDALARDGLVETAGRHGTIVLDGSKVTTSSTDLAAAADTLAVVTRQLGLEPDAAHQALDDALGRL
ncbi:MAG: GntR family transcriptional regulator [Acidimicrobiia bacterium]|nr:GntR family transcriptional regulator [Acidimicrobiia bacterium]